MNTLLVDKDSNRLVDNEGLEENSHREVLPLHLYTCMGCAMDDGYSEEEVMKQLSNWLAGFPTITIDQWFCEKHTPPAGRVFVVNARRCGKSFMQGLIEKLQSYRTTLEGWK